MRGSWPASAGVGSSAIPVADALRSDDAARVLGFVAAGAGRETARQLADSGLPAFEAALLSFLVNNRRREFLLNMCTRIGVILDDQAGPGKDTARLAGLRAELGAAEPTSQPVTPLFAATTAIASDLPGCEVCARVAEAVFDFVANYQYQLRGDHRAQVDLAERHGPCAWHASLFEAVAAPGEVCSAFAGVMDRETSLLRATAHAEPSGALARQAVTASLPTAQSCPVCGCAQQATNDAIRAVARRLQRDQAAALGALSAICLPHLRLLVGTLGNPALIRDVLLREAGILDRLAEDMRRFVLKGDAVRWHLTSKEEVVAAQRALRVLVSHPRAQIGPEEPPLAGYATPFRQRTAASAMPARREP